MIQKKSLAEISKMEMYEIEQYFYERKYSKEELNMILKALGLKPRIDLSKKSLTEFVSRQIRDIELFKRIANNSGAYPNRGRLIVSKLLEVRKTLKNKIQELEKSITEKEETFQAIKTELKELEQEVKVLRQEAEKISIETAPIRAEIQALKSALTALE